ncbi:MAG TPA: hypothetical protein VH879_06105 [Gemmatimonadales bacterium]
MTGLSLGGRGRLVLGLACVEILLAAFIYVRGFPYFGSELVSNAPLWEIPLALVHLPGIQLLSMIGLCCGFRNGLVLTHVVRGGHIPMQLAGTGILAATNWLCWLGAVWLGSSVWRRYRARSAPPASQAPGV